MTKLFEERQLLAELQITLLLRTKKDNRIHAAASLAHHEKSFVQKGGNDRAKCTHIPNICRRYAFDSLVLFWRSGMLVNVFSDLGFHHCCLDSEMQKQLYDVMIVGYVLLERPHLLSEMAEILFLQHLLLNTLSIVVIISHHHFALSLLLSLCSNKIFFKQIRTTTGTCMLLCAVMTNTCIYYTTYACHY